MFEIKPFEHYLIDVPNLVNEDLSTGRLYVLPDGRRFPSVTTVLGWQPDKKDVLGEWRARVGNEEADRISNMASNRGTAIHKMCEKYLLNEEGFEKANVFIQPLFKSIYPIIRDHVGKVYGVESSLFSERLKIAGRTDCIGDYDGIPSIIDFKTSTKSKREEWITDYFMQGALYAMMLFDQTGLEVKQMVIIIAVENEAPQVFKEQVKHWMKPALRIVNAYYRAHK